MSINVRNEKWTEEELLDARGRELARWPTGKDVDLDEAIEYCSRLPESKLWHRALEKARKDGTVLVQPCVGHATWEETSEHLIDLVQNGVDLLFLEYDAYTRKCWFEAAEKAIERSKREGRSMLSGYPIVNYGVQATRSLLDAVDVPIAFNGGNDEEPMLAAEIGLASGITRTICHDLRDLITHCKDYPLDKRIRNNQYCMRLAGYYTERGAPIVVEEISTIVGLCPPGLGIALQVIGSLIAAEQGVKYLSLCYDIRGNFIQDVASIRVSRPLVDEYLKRFGYQVNTYSNIYPWSWEWPKEGKGALSFSAWITATASLAGVDWIYVKSPEEAASLPSKEGNALAVREAKYLLGAIRHQRLPESDDLQLEKDMINKEATAIVEKVLELGDGDVAKGMLGAVDAGVLDFPFSSWIGVKGRVLPVRDTAGAIRYLDPGNVPLPKEVREYHTNKIREREEKEGTQADIKMTIADIRRLART